MEFSGGAAGGHSASSTVSTSKPPGSGSGLGLNIAYDIVVNKHHGEIHLTSHPGETCFQIVLPIHLEEKKP